MSEALLDALRRYAQAHLSDDGIARTAINGLYSVRASRTGALQQSSRHTMLCLVGQGAKRVCTGDRTLQCEAGDSMLVAPHQPASARIVGASSATPYLSLALRIDPQIVAELSVEMPVADRREGHEAADRELADTAARMVRLLDRPSSIPVLQHQLRREMHHWLLAGRHGAWLRRVVPQKWHADQIARAVDLIRREFRSPLAAERLAATAGMGLSSFYQSFRDVTSLSPLQYQKRLRLSEARRLLLGKCVRVSDAAFAVGYESVPQFVREYRRAFGSPPGRDAAEARQHARREAPF